MTDDTTTEWMTRATELLEEGALDGLDGLDADAKRGRFRAFLRALPTVSAEGAEKAGAAPVNFLDQVADARPPTAPYYVATDEEEDHRG